MRSFRGILLLIFFCSYGCFIVRGQDAVYDFPPGKEGVEQMLEYILNASNKDRKAITEWLKPSKEDCDSVFSTDLAEKVYKYQRKLSREVRIIIRPLLKNQTEYIFWEASSQELFDYTSEARFFPGGYKEVASYLRPDLEFYRFKFIQPGRKLGSAYDVLVYINGKWCLIHRPWAVLLN